MTVRILAIHAHPDDLEILAAGTLAHLSRQGHSITIVTMTAGDCGTAEYDAETISAMRREEARRAAEMIGATYVCAEFRDLAIFNDDPSRRRVTELMRRAQPDIVLTSSPVDYHCDHEATSSLVRDACFAAPAPNYQSGDAPVLGRIPHLYFLDPDEGRDREGRTVTPDFIVDVARAYGAEEAHAGQPREPARLAAEASWDGQLHRDDGTVDKRSRPVGGPNVWRRIPAISMPSLPAVATFAGIAGAARQKYQRSLTDAVRG